MGSRFKTIRLFLIAQAVLHSKLQNPQGVASSDRVRGFPFGPNVAKTGSCMQVSAGQGRRRQVVHVQLAKINCAHESLRHNLHESCRILKELLLCYNRYEFKLQIEIEKLQIKITNCFAASWAIEMQYYNELRITLHFSS